MKKQLSLAAATIFAASCGHQPSAEKERETDQKQSPASNLYQGSKLSIQAPDRARMNGFLEEALKPTDKARILISSPHVKNNQRSVDAQDANKRLLSADAFLKIIGDMVTSEQPLRTRFIAQVDNLENGASFTCDAKDEIGRYVSKAGPNSHYDCEYISPYHNKHKRPAQKPKHLKQKRLAPTN